LRGLKPDGLFLITEVFPDPHYQRRSRVLKLGEAAGFRREAEFGGWLAFTVNFVKP
jgi:hypothetical protein